MNDIFTVSAEDNLPKSLNIIYGLTLLLDLANTFYGQGSYLNSISAKHGFPLAELELIAIRLETAELLERHPEDRNRLMLKRAPEGQWIIEIMPILKSALRSG